MLKAAVEGRLVPTEASLARAEKRDYEPAEVLLARILKERRRRWEEAELAKLKAAGKTPKDDKWKAKYEEPVAPDTSTLPELPEGWCWAASTNLGWRQGGLTQNASRDHAARLKRAVSSGRRTSTRCTLMLDDDQDDRRRRRAKFERARAAGQGTYWSSRVTAASIRLAGLRLCGRLDRADAASRTT